MLARTCSSICFLSDPMRLTIEAEIDTANPDYVPPETMTDVAYVLLLCGSPDKFRWRLEGDQTTHQETFPWKEGTTPWYKRLALWLNQ